MAADVLLQKGFQALAKKLSQPANGALIEDAERGCNVEFGPVLQTEIGRTQFNGKLFFQRRYRAAGAYPT